MSTTVTVAPAVLVNIDTGDMYKRDQLVGDFLEWCMAEKIFSFRGTGASGPGFHQGVYPAEHAEKIEAWFKANAP